MRSVSVPLLMALAFVAVNTVAATGRAPSGGVQSPPATAADRAWQLVGPPASPADNRPSAARIALGARLFADPRLSRDGTVSCASCHDASKGWSDAGARVSGLAGQMLQRRTPSLVNVGYNRIFMWDGRAQTLERQALLPIEGTTEMGTTMAAVMDYLAEDAMYRRAFAAAYPRDPIGPVAVGKALAAFERTIVARHAPFDRWLAGDAHAMSATAVRGFRFFVEPARGNCASCHAAPTFTDNGFHNIGVATGADDHDDAGRYAVKPVAVSRGAFKTPSLRNVALHPPYFHNGSAATLADVVEHYRRGGDDHRNLSADMHALTMSADDVADLLAFLDALTDDGASAGHAAYRAPPPPTTTGVRAGH